MSIDPSDSELEELIQRALDELPQEFRDRMENLAILIDDEPPEGERWLATYQGAPLTRRSSLAPWQWPHKITFYRGPILRHYGASQEQLEREIKHLVRHEVAHLFGISDERLKELGRY